MGLLTLLPKLPVLPLIEVIRIGELIRAETERQFYDPAQVRRELEEAQQKWATGGMSEDELSRIEYAATTRLYRGVPADQRQVPANRRQMKRGDRHG